MSWCPRTLYKLRILLTAIILLAVTLVSCTRAQPRPRPTQPFAAIAPVSPLLTPSAVPSQPAATPTLPTQLIVTPATSTPLPEELPFYVEPVRTIGEKLEMVPGQIIVKLRGESAVQALAAEPEEDGIVSTGLPFIDRLNQFFDVYAFEPLVRPLARAVGKSVEILGIEQPDLVGYYLVSFDTQYDPEEVATAYEADPDVDYAEPNYIAYASDGPVAPQALVPNDPFFSYQWHMPFVQAPQAWDVSTGQGVLIAVLDTGVAYEDFGGFRRAPDLGNTSFAAGYDFINDDSHPNDDEGHGTHVAGTIAQSTNNAQGVTGVAFDATLMPVKVLDSRGQGSHDAIAQGIIFATDRGAQIINLSLSGRTGSSTLAEAIDYATSKGVLVIAAAGNSGGAIEYPAAYANVMAIGAVGYDRTRVDYSNFGSQLDLVAPGGNTDVDLNGDGYPDGVLQQTFRGDPTEFGFYYYEGTSMAAPHVSGIAALLFARNPAATASQVRQAMETTALNLGSANEYGNGLVQAASALEAIGGPQPVTPTPTRTPTPTTQPPTPTFTPTSPSPSPSPTSTFTSTPPTATLTPTPTLPPVSENIIINGNFEGDDGWIFSSTRHPASYSTQVVHGGARSARAGIVDGIDRYSYSSIVQRVTIPADARRATLTYWVYPISDDVFPRDIQMVLILSERFRTIASVDRTLSDAQQWVQRSYDMTPLAGRTVYVYFGVYNGGRTGQMSAMYVDDVSLIVDR
jgi:serine protease